MLNRTDEALTDVTLMEPIKLIITHNVAGIIELLSDESGFKSHPVSDFRKGIIQ